MAEKLQFVGTAKTVERVVTADSVLDAANSLRDLEPAFGRPGRKLGL